MAKFVITVNINPAEARPYCKWRILETDWFDHGHTLNLSSSGNISWPLEGLGENGWTPSSGFGIKNLEFEYETIEGVRDVITHSSTYKSLLNDWVRLDGGVLPAPLPEATSGYEQFNKDMQEYWDTYGKNMTDFFDWIDEGEYGQSYSWLDADQPYTETEKVDTYYTFDVVFDGGSSGGTPSTGDTGSLRVVITPGDIGAQWRLKGSTDWKNSQSTIGSIPVGTAIIEFKPVTGYITPDDKTADIRDNDTTIYSISYTEEGEDPPPTTPPATSPDECSPGEGFDWFDSGHTELVEPGQYNICFKTIDGWVKPDKIRGMNVLLGDELVRSGTYNKIETTRSVDDEPEVTWPEENNTYNPPRIIDDSTGNGDAGEVTGKLTIRLKDYETKDFLGPATGAAWRIVGTDEWYTNNYMATGIVIPDGYITEVDVIAKTIEDYQEQTEIYTISIYPNINSQRTIYYYPLEEGEEQESKEDWIITAYDSICRGPQIGPGGDPTQIDRGGFDYWKREINNRGWTTYSQFKTAFDAAVQHWFDTHPEDDPYTLYVKDCLGEDVDNGQPSTSETGKLKVVIKPNSISNEARWRRKGTENWYRSGDTEKDVPVGLWNIEYKPVGNWSGDTNVKSEITANTLTTLRRRYKEKDPSDSDIPASNNYDTGNLQVIITPGDIGAEWKLVGYNYYWRDSQQTISDLPVGRVTIEFTRVSGYVTPSNKIATIEKNQTTVKSVGYALIEDDPTPPPSTDPDKEAKEIVRRLYATISRGPAIGNKVSQIDPGGFNYWLGQAKSGLSYSTLLSNFDSVIREYLRDNPNTPYAIYIKANNTAY